MKIEIDDIQRKKLKNIQKNSQSYSVRQRVQAILLFDQGKTNLDDLASIINVCSTSIYNWIIRWQENGIEGLYDLEGRGRKPLFSFSEELTIISLIEDTPDSMIKIVDEVEDLTGKRAHVETLRRIAKKHGKVWKRKRKILKGKPDEEAYKQGKADIEELKLLSSQGDFDLAYFDASGVSLEPVVPYAWQDIGREKTLTITSSKSKRLNLLGFLNPEKNEFTGEQILGNINSEDIINAMDSYCEKITSPVVVILDNASVNTSKKVSEKIPEWDEHGLTLYFLPKYSPELNLIEIFWRIMKYKWIPSSAYESISSLSQSIEEIFSNYGDKYKINFNLV
jgi:transposase